MTPIEFKSRLAPLVAENRNHEAVNFVRAHLADIRGSMTVEDRMLVADWMEGVEMMLDLEVRESGTARTAST